MNDSSSSDISSSLGERGLELLLYCVPIVLISCLAVNATARFVLLQSNKRLLCNRKCVHAAQLSNYARGVVARYRLGKGRQHTLHVWSDMEDLFVGVCFADLNVVAQESKRTNEAMLQALASCKKWSWHGLCVDLPQVCVSWHVQTAMTVLLWIRKLLWQRKFRYKFHIIQSYLGFIIFWSIW